MHQSFRFDTPLSYSIPGVSYLEIKRGGDNTAYISQSRLIDISPGRTNNNIYENVGSKMLVEFNINISPYYSHLIGASASSEWNQ